VIHFLVLDALGRNSILQGAAIVDILVQVLGAGVVDNQRVLGQQGVYAVDAHPQVREGGAGGRDARSRPGGAGLALGGLADYPVVNGFGGQGSQGPAVGLVAAVPEDVGRMLVGRDAKGFVVFAVDVEHAIGRV
jgi:hypothetical protein